MVAKPAKARPAIIGLAIGAVGVAISLVAWVGVNRLTEGQMQARFQEIAAVRAERIEQALERYRNDLLHLAGHLADAEYVDGGTFHKLAHAHVEPERGLQAVAWLAPAAKGQPAPFAVRLPPNPAGADAVPTAGVREAVPYAAWHVAHFATEQASVDPVAWGHVSAVSAALDASARIGGAVMTAPLATGDFATRATYGVVVPIYRRPSASEPPAMLRGFLVGVYRAQTMVEAALGNAQPPIALALADPGVGPGGSVLAEYAPARPEAGGSLSPHRIALTVDNRTWHLEFTPTQTFVAENETDEALLTLLLGLALSGAAALGGLASARWRSRVLELVASRTADLAASEARQRAVVANMADALVVTDRDGKIESVNAAAQRMFGWEAGELLGRELSLLLAGGDSSAPDRKSGARPGQGEATCLPAEEIDGLRRDGSTFPLAIVFNEVHERDGVRRVAVLRDVSRERRAERAMSTFIAGTSNATGRAFLDAATRSLAQALGVRHAFIAQALESESELHIVSLWSGQGHEPEQVYALAGEPCETVFGRQMYCHAGRVRESFPDARLMRRLSAECYLGHPLRTTSGRALGIVAIVDVNPLVEATLAASLVSMTAARVSAELERIENDQALLRSRERLELAVEGSQLALWDLNVATGEVFLSERWSTMMGARPQPTVTTLARLFASVHPEDQTGVDQAYRAAICGTAPFYEVTHRVMRSDGGFVWVRSHGKVSQRDDDGRALRLVGTNADVTWEKNAVEEVSRRERELRTISDNVPATIVRLDRQLRFLYANQRFASLVGVSPLALSGKHLADLIGREEYAAFERFYRRALEGEMATYDRECDVGGHTRWLEVTVIPEKGPDSEVQGCLAIGIDITERKEIEHRTVEARNSAEAAARAKSEFLAMMSHEIRTPMNGVIGLAGLLRESDLSAEQRDCVDILNRSATGLLDILNDILDMSKIEAGKLALEPVAFDLVTTVEDVAALWAAKAAAKGLEMVVAIDAECPRRVIGDAGRLGQVLGNLVGNAVKFTEAGHVLIRVRPEPGSDDEARVLFEVEDTGVGLAEGVSARLFQPFSQADASTTRRFGGTGLGLAICRRLVELMGGDIGVDTERGSGARFFFHAALPADTLQTVRGPSLREGLRVLLVQRHPVAREVLARRLAAACFEVASAADVAGAMRCAHESVPGFDIALIDHESAGGDALALGSRLRSDARHRSLPMILLTSAGHAIDNASLEGSGFLGSLRKPVRTDALFRMLERALTRFPAPRGMVTEEPPVVCERVYGTVLLVEDNEVNRRVAVAALRKIGAEVVAESNGLQALERIKQRAYSLILMDMHMPEMDGLEATRAIRRLEGRDGSRVPIVAMTANVLPEARAACLAAGMDGFIAKPLVREQLLDELRRWLPQGDAPLPARVLPLRAKDAPAKRLDYARLTALREAMRSDFDELVTVFLETTDVLVNAMRSALQAGDAQALYRHAHTLKSSAGNVGAEKLSRLARSLEAHAHAGVLFESSRLIDGLSFELERVRRRLRPVGARELEGVRDAAS